MILGEKLRSCVSILWFLLQVIAKDIPEVVALLSDLNEKVS